MTRELSPKVPEPSYYYHEMKEPPYYSYLTGAPLGHNTKPYRSRGFYSKKDMIEFARAYAAWKVARAKR